MSTTYNPTNTLNPIHGKTLFKTTAQILHFMHLMIGDATFVVFFACLWVYMRQPLS
jgi:hypothetical protein